MEAQHLTKEDATKFFSQLYYGEHHFPAKLKECGYGFSMQHTAGLATFDYNQLTRLVVMAHDQCIRVEVRAKTFRAVEICIWKRQGREGGMSERHPELEEHIASIRKSNHS